MKQKLMTCLKNECYLENNGRPDSHTMRGLRQNPTGEAMEQVWACDRCGTERQTPIPKPRCHKRTWPYYNESAGVTFESESHEQKHCKEHGLTPINA